METNPNAFLDRRRSFFPWLALGNHILFFLRSPNDRGFLLLPICPIYGFALILVYLLFGTPADMRLLGHPVLRSKPVLRYLSYFLAAALLSTAIELVTATFFQSMFGIKLWSYAFLTDSFSEFISLLPSLFGGLPSPSLCASSSIPSFMRSAK